MNPLLDGFVWPFGLLRPAVRTPIFTAFSAAINSGQSVGTSDQRRFTAAAELDSASEVANAVKARCIEATNIGNSTQRPLIAKIQNEIHPASPQKNPKSFVRQPRFADGTRGITDCCVLAEEKKAAYPAGDLISFHQRPNEGMEGYAMKQTTTAAFAFQRNRSIWKSPTFVEQFEGPVCSIRWFARGPTDAEAGHRGGSARVSPGAR